MKCQPHIARAAILVYLILSVAGCREHIDDKNKEISAFAIYGHSPGATYVVFINGEPAGWASGTDDYMIRGFPIRRGTNQIVIQTVFDPGQVAKMPHYYAVVASMRICAQETTDAKLKSTNWNLVSEFNDRWNTNEPLVTRMQFEMKNEVSDNKFEELGTNQEYYADQCRSMSLKLAGLIKNQDYDALANVLGLTNTDNDEGYSFQNDISLAYKTNLLINCPEICPALAYPEFFVDNKDVSASGITNEKEIEAEAGERLILLHCNHDAHFVSFANHKIIEKSSTLNSAPFHHYGILNIDSFVFGRVDGNWRVMANGTGWMNLNQKMLNNQN